MQLIANIRKYKGCDEIYVHDKKTPIDISGSFDQWDKTDIIYRDFPGGAMHRRCKGYGVFYKDESGRNEIITSKFAYDDDNLYFYAETPEKITDFEYHTAWMNLYLKTDTDKPNYKGYNYMTNAYVFSDTKTSLSRCDKNGHHSFRIFEQLEHKLRWNKYMLKIPRKAIGLDNVPEFNLEFKWLDSRDRIHSIEDFYTSGDAAPIGRLNYPVRVR